jgi:methionyl-tRNA formyltransferase
MGTPDFAVPSLKLINSNFNVLAVFSQPARPNGRGLKTKKSSVETAAKELNLNIITPLTLNDEQIFSEFDQLKPDLVVVVAYGLLLPEKYLKVPKYGCINGHASLLPRWRGAAPIQRAIEAGDTKTGSCIMLMEKGMDTGPIISSEIIDIREHDTSKVIHDKLSVTTAELLIQAIKNFRNREIFPTNQKNNGITYAKKIDKNETEINWKLTSIEIFNKVRAFDPFPGTYTRYSDDIIKIIKTNLSDIVHTSEPGTIIDSDQKIIIACGNKSALEIKVLQKPGKKIISANDFLNGTKINIGEKFGN